MLDYRRAMRSTRPEEGSAELWAIEEADRDALRRDGLLFVCVIGVGLAVALAVLTALTVLG